jgi:adenylyltransferase/sulfurtransferase
MVEQVDPRVLRDRLAAGELPTVLDVREPEEIQIARFPGAVEIPMSEIPNRLGELDKNDEIIVLCHHGVRSAHVAGYLAQNGFRAVRNLAGGIDAWALLVDPSIARY